MQANDNNLKVNNIVILKFQFTIFWIQVAAVSVSHLIKLIALNAKCIGVQIPIATGIVNCHSIYDTLK